MYEVDQYTVSLLHFDDGIKDETGKVWTANGGATVSTAQSKFGVSSLSLNGTNKYLATSNTSDFNFGSGDFTIDCWIYPVTLTSSQIQNSIFDTHYQGYNGIVLTMIQNRIYILVTVDGKNWIQSSAIIPAANTWYHVAAIRNGSNLYISLNGVLSSPSILNGSLVAGTAVSAQIGQIPEGGAYLFDGYIDEIRVSKGIARWTSDFTPPGLINIPNNLTAIAGGSQVTLSWTAVDGVTGYNVKRSTTAGGPYTIIATNVTGTSYADIAVVNGTIYYYVVTAVNSSSNESTDSNEASATPQASSGHGLLRITMNDSSEREYELTTSEIEDFVKWFNRTIGTGTTGYVFNKAVQNSKEYLSFEKIISFEVIPLKD